MSKFALLSILCLVLIVFIIVTIFKNDVTKEKYTMKESFGEEKLSKPKELENLFTPEVYEALKKFGIEQDDDTLKGILIASYSISSVQSSFVEECVNSSVLENDSFFLSDNDKLILLITKFNKSLNLHLSTSSMLVKLLETKDDKSLIRFFKSFKSHERVQSENVVLVFDDNLFYKMIKEDFQKNFPEEFEFTKKQTIVFNDIKFPAFDYVFQSFISVYKRFQH
ncbi:hypothetical protein NGRA_2244 [Nosema granulosis]|uniref:Uncharacterized protein n=1 Tax=Nosema granulosis TaxID=83296 RepID=A0A9P6GXI8_9MICR|nr:hypothetical protein NGRA_2244 [Nosema granulosis]